MRDLTSSLRRTLLSLLLPTAVACFDAMAAPPSTLDPDFGAGGKVVSSPDGSEQTAGNDIALQADGKIVMVGSKKGPTNGSVAVMVARYNSDGSLDNTFSDDGWITLEFGADFEDGNQIEIQQDGKIVVAGTTYTAVAGGPPIREFLLARLNANGTLDTSFDVDGKLTIDMNGPLGSFYEEYLSVLKIAGDGKIVVAGSILLGGFEDRFVLARVNPDGSLDNTFGTGGKLVDISNGSSNGNALTDAAILADGSVVVSVAWYSIIGSFRGAIKYDNSATRVWNYRAGPISQNAHTREGTYGIAHLPDGKFILVGKRDNKIVVSRLLANGTEDSMWADVVATPSGTALSVAIQPDGKIVTNVSFTGSSTSFSLMRFMPTGLIDSSFGTAGIVNTDVSEGQDNGKRVLLQPDGKILVGGSSLFFSPARSFFTLVRYIGDAAAPTPALFDYDADGRADVSVFRPSENKWYIFRSSDSTIMQPVFAIAGDVPVPADYDGDAKTDVAIYRPSNGAWWYLSSLNGAQINVNWGGETGDIPRPSDFDADGKTDFVFFRPSNNFWYRINSAGTVSNVQFGLAGDKPVRGDFDGDGKGDVAIYRPSTGDWWYRSSINNAQLAVKWGISTDIPAPADFDGDGKTDFAVYRPSTGVWYIINSSNGSFNIGAFGLSEDKPVPADFDGDGKADVAVFRPSTGIWYMSRSTSGFGATQWGISTDIPTEGAFLP